jgi:XTP/dITP diphosphohydrolase
VRLDVITSNPGKVREFETAFGKLGIDVGRRQLAYDEIQSSELEEVVAKGMAAIRAQGVNDFIIDDSGLFIDALGGFPGVWSAYAQKTIGNTGILKLMENVADRGAEFRCCIGCGVGDEDIIVTGVCRGSITDAGRGAGGFGFDPIFTHDGVRTFAELPTDEKEQVSHRGEAIRLLVGAISARGLI